MAWLCHAGCEDSVLDGVSPALRARASDFGKTQSHQKSSPPPSRPPTADSLISLSGSDGTLQMVHPCTNCDCAVIPDGAPDPLSSTRQLGGGSKPRQPSAPVYPQTSPLSRGIPSILLTQQPTRTTVVH